MNIVCIGGGPAGLYTAVLARLGGHDVTVLERNPAGATYGWSVTFAENFLDDLYRHDQVSARAVHGEALLWADQVVRVGGARPVHLGGKYGYSINRTRMLDILADRAVALGADVRFETDVDAPVEADLVVAADGAGSRLRTQHAEHFGTTIDPGRNRYVWLGTSKAFEAFTFAFEQTHAGLIWFYAYPSSQEASTCIVECSPETWAGLGLDTMEPDAALRMLEGVFAGPLDGQALLGPVGGPQQWLHFREIRNRTWQRGNLVLVGDAAHTTHFGVGAGTVLAVEDAIALAAALRTSGGDLATALPAYDSDRRATMGPVQDTARRSMQWFERIDPHPEVDPVRFAYSLLDRRGDQPAWQYQVHRATQIDPLRRVRRTITAARRVRATRRRAHHAPAE